VSAAFAKNEAEQLRLLSTQPSAFQGYASSFAVCVGVKGAALLYVGSPLVNEETMRPDHGFRSVFFVFLSALTQLSDRTDI